MKSSRSRDTVTAGPATGHRQPPPDPGPGPSEPGLGPSLSGGGGPAGVVPGVSGVDSDKLENDRD